MIFSSRLHVGDLIELCRAMRLSLRSGLTLCETMELIANRGPRSLRPIAGKIAGDLRQGWQLQQSLENHKSAFPPVFVALVEVGEESGKLPDVLGHLEEYYTRAQGLRRELASGISWPVTEFAIAVVVLTVLICLMGIVQAGTGPKIEPLGLGLVGPRGAIEFAGVVFGALLAVGVLFALVRHFSRRWAPVDWGLHHVPLLDNCLAAIVLTRFCVAFRLMLETNISTLRTMRLALLATDDQRYINSIPIAEASLRRGNSIPMTLAETGVFPEPFLGVVSVADARGQLPEALAVQSREYDDFARRRLTLLSRLLGWCIWLFVAVCIGVAIFRIFLIAYRGEIEHFANFTR